MTQTPEAQQVEPRNKTVGLNVTASEYRDIAFVAAFRQLSQSDLLREMLLAEVTTLANRLRVMAQSEAVA